MFHGLKLLHRESEKRRHQTRPYLRQMLTKFQNSFTAKLSSKFAVKWSLKISPHLNCVATLPCESSCVQHSTVEHCFAQNEYAGDLTATVMTKASQHNRCIWPWLPDRQYQAHVTVSTRLLQHSTEQSFLCEECVFLRHFIYCCSSGVQSVFLWIFQCS